MIDTLELPQWLGETRRLPITIMKEISRNTATTLHKCIHFPNRVIDRICRRHQKKFIHKR